MTTKLEKKYLSLHDLEDIYGLKGSTIKKERWSQKKIQQNKTHYIDKDGNKQKIKYNQDDSSGFGFEVPAIKIYGRLMYETELVDAWFDKQKANAPATDIAELNNA